MKFLHTIVFVTFFLGNTLLSQEYLDKRFAEIQKQLQDPDISARLCSIDEIYKVLMEHIPQWPQFIHSQKKYDPSHEETIRKFFSLLTIALHDSEGSVRCNAALVLQKAGIKFENGIVTHHAIGLLSDPDSKVRYLAAEALGEIKDIRAIIPLIKLLRDRDPYMRGFAASALGNMRVQEAVDDLIRLLGDRSCYRYGRIFAAEALGNIRDGKAIEPLLSALGDEEELIAYSAARSIGEMAYLLDAKQARKASESLLKLLKSPNEYTRHRAVWAIRKIFELVPDKQVASEIENKVANIVQNKLANVASDSEFWALQEIRKSDPHFTMKVQAPGLIFFGKSVEFKITITNEGIDPASDAVLSHTLASCWDYISSSPRTEYSPSDRTVAWNLGVIPARTQREIFLRVRHARSGGRIESVFSLTSQGRQYSESAAVNVMTCGGGIMLMHIEDTEDPVKAGKVTIYILEATKFGTTTATNVKFECIIPDKMVFASAETPVPYQIKGDRIIFDTIPAMEPDKKLTFKIVCLAISEGSCKLVSMVRYDQFTHSLEDEEGTTIYK